jgi:hypothetical protein
LRRYQKLAVERDAKLAFERADEAARLGQTEAAE